MDKEQLKAIIADLEEAGLGLSGMKEVLHLLAAGRPLETGGDVFGFLESSMERYVDVILKRAGDLSAFMEEA